MNIFKTFSCCIRHVCIIEWLFKMELVKQNNKYLFDLKGVYGGRYRKTVLNLNRKKIHTSLLNISYLLRCDAQSLYIIPSRQTTIGWLKLFQYINCILYCFTNTFCRYGYARCEGVLLSYRKLIILLKLWVKSRLPLYGDHSDLYNSLEARSRPAPTKVEDRKNIEPTTILHNSCCATISYNFIIASYTRILSTCYYHIIITVSAGVYAWAFVRKCLWTVTAKYII